MPIRAINNIDLSNYIKLNKMEENLNNNETPQLGIDAVERSFTKDEFINILQKRADKAFHKFHEYERNQILKAIDIITRLVPPSSFPDW